MDASWWSALGWSGTEADGRRWGLGGGWSCCLQAGVSSVCKRTEPSTQDPSPRVSPTLWRFLLLLHQKPRALNSMFVLL